MSTARCDRCQRPAWMCHGYDECHLAAVAHWQGEVEQLRSLRVDDADKIIAMESQVERLRALLGECRTRLNRPPFPGLLTFEAQDKADRDYNDRDARIDAALRDNGAVTHPMGGEDGSGPTSGGAT